MRLAAGILALAFLGAVPRPPEYFAAVEGKPANAGTREEPWDLQSALGGAHEIQPGATLWIRKGTYKGKFEVRLAGTKDAPIHVRAVPGERVTILDSGLWIVKPADYVWIRDLEIAGSTPVEKRKTSLKGSHPKDLPGTGGLNVYAGRGCKFINLVIHDNVRGGVGWWVQSVDTEFHGCIIYNNGWDAPDRGHGHCIYAQNRNGTKTISNCIMTVPPWGGSYTMHAYGSSRAYVDNFIIEDNIAFTKGRFLVGGGRPSRNIRVLRNYLHGVNMQIGYSAPHNEDCEVRDNLIAKGRLSIRKYRTKIDEGNVLEMPSSRAVLIPNRYDPARAHVAVYNGAGAPSVPLSIEGFLKPGDRFRVLRATDVFGKPVLEGTIEGASISVPMSGEFAAFLLLKR